MANVEHSPEDLKSLIYETAGKLGFQSVGFTTAERLNEEGAQLEIWLDEGRHGTMGWMARRQDERRDPLKYYPPVRTVVSLAINYHTQQPARPDGAPLWSNYAWGEDYHRLMKKRIKALLAEVVEAYPGVQGIACVDTSPVMEKAWAQRAGLGWQGKHTNLITRDYGSWVFLGELLLDVALEPDDPFGEDLCGSCTACLEACPTGALTGAYRIDARRCISYLTIEHRGDFTAQQIAWLNGWIYGCDICQAVCPWNLKFARISPETAFRPREFITTNGWEDWARLSREQWKVLLHGSAAKRTGFDGLKRNVLAQVQKEER